MPFQGTLRASGYGEVQEGAKDMLAWFNCETRQTRLVCPFLPHHPWFDLHGWELLPGPVLQQHTTRHCVEPGHCGRRATCLWSLALTSSSPPMTGWSTTGSAARPWTR